MQEHIPSAGAPDWSVLLTDEAAIDRMTSRLLAEISLESGAVDIAGPWEARAFVKALILAAGQEAKDSLETD
jgi:hypothetical protein